MILAAAAAEAPAGTFTELMDHVAQGFEALAAAILVVGVIWSFVLAAGRDGRRGDDPPRGVHRAGAQAAAVIPGLPVRGANQLFTGVRKDTVGPGVEAQWFFVSTAPRPVSGSGCPALSSGRKWKL